MLRTVRSLGSIVGCRSLLPLLFRRLVLREGPTRTIRCCCHDGQQCRVQKDNLADVLHRLGGQSLPGLLPAKDAGVLVLLEAESVAGDDEVPEGLLVETDFTVRRGMSQGFDGELHPSEVAVGEGVNDFGGEDGAEVVHDGHTGFA